MIYIIPVKKQKLPKINPFVAHSPGYNVETEFINFLNKSRILTDNPDDAQWHYLPILWSHWQLSNNYGRYNRKEMQEYLTKIILDDTKTFTVSEADNEPGFEIGETRVFSGNQSIGYQGKKWTPIPLITLPHKLPTVLPEKEYLTNFVGSLNTHPIRRKMAEVLKDRNYVKIIQSSKGEELFVNTILESYSTLCPRGSAMSSYRFYESMQLGVVPIMIADEDFRPFPDRIYWDSCSFYVDDVNKLPDFLDSLRESELDMMGRNAQKIWELLSHKWPEYVIDLL